ncbi:hypothetical protein AVEN_174052-1 [Araneus ventricosus]|uniref:Uncharacterized protein n=1 Tax=Araneus ventricosus TaxID=182803 RepID=A0A4Y2C4J1_ARAVE|nr:hypothetical protein AVEN_174052-1 [Araneus ventricosus]
MTCLEGPKLHFNTEKTCNWTFSFKRVARQWNFYKNKCRGREMNKSEEQGAKGLGLRVPLMTVSPRSSISTFTGSDFMAHKVVRFFRDKDIHPFFMK